MPEILEFKIENIKINENSVRTTTTEQIEQQINIIKRFGRLILPVVINSENTVLEDIEVVKKKGKAELLDYIKQLHSHIDSRTTLIREDKPLRNDIHPTMKPLKLLARLMVNSSKPNWNVLDLFRGSGSTLMTAEQLNRKAFLMEFDPKYADVIVKRFHSMHTGKDISLIRNGKTYSWKEIEDNFADER